MIFKSIIILILAGSSWELQASLQYKYKYFASISTGIPELSSQAAGWAMKADVEVFVDEKKSFVIFKLSNTRTVEFNEDLGCNSRGDIPEDRFASISDPELASAIETPFRLRLNGSFHYGDEAIDYHGDKYRWLVNFRKGIASAFKNEVIRGNVKSKYDDNIFRKKNPPNVFTVEEETLFGICKVRYTWNKLPSRTAEQKEKDIQLPPKFESEEPESQESTNNGTRKIPKELSYIHVIRTVDFDNCKEMVGFQINSVEHSEVTKGQHEWRRGRSSVSEYIFLGVHRAFRMERAVVEGVTLVSPFGFQTELLQARTNQTFELVSVTVAGEIPHISDEVKASWTWMHQVWSFAKYPSFSKPQNWVDYTGEGDAIGRLQTFGVDYTSSEQIQEIKKAIISKITTAAVILSDLHQEFTVDEPESPSKLLQDSSFLFKFLSENSTLEVFGAFFEKDMNNTNVLARKLVIDAAAASGFLYAIDAIMVYIKEGKLSDLQVATFFMTLASNVECACAMPEILEWVLTLDIKERPLLTSTVLINFAHLVKEMCLYPKARNVNFAGPSFGDAGCNRQKIMKEFRPYVSKLLEDENDWVKIVGIFVISTLKDPSSLELVVPFIENKHQYSNTLRIQAISALEREHLDSYDHLKTHIVDMLTSIYTNVEEKVIVREAALIVISTWTEDPSFYHTLARMSWREPSRRFASFITSFLKYEAGFGKAAASFAAKLTKPTIPSLTFSNIFSSYRKYEKNQMTSFDSVYVFKSNRLSDIFILSLYSDYGFGEIDFTILWASMFIESGSVIRNLLHHFSEYKEFKAGDGTPVKRKEFYKKIEESLKFIFNVPEEKKKEDYVNIYIKFLQHLQILLPLNNYTLSNLAIPSFTTLIENLRNESNLVLGKFFNPVDFTMFHPTELGLPLFISGSSPAVVTDVSSIALKDHADRKSLEVLSLGSFSSEYHSRLYVLLPWNQKRIETGITSKRDITLPLQMKIEAGEMDRLNVINLMLECPYKTQAFSVAKASNVPYTSIGPIVPLRNDHSKIISKSEPKKHLVPILRQFTVLDLNLTLEAEEPTSLFGNWNPLDMLSSQEPRKPYLFYAFVSPTVKYWSADLKFHQNSLNNQVVFDIGTGTLDKKTMELHYKTIKEALSRNPDFQEEDEGNLDNCRNLLFKLTFLERCFGEEIKVNAITSYLGKGVPPKYEVSTTSSEVQESESRKIERFNLKFQFEPLDEFDFTLLCLDLEESVPVFSSLDTFEDVINADLHKRVRANFTLWCEGDPLLTMQGLYQISDEWKKKHQDDAEEGCDSDPHDSLYTFNNNAVYDQVNFSLTFQKVCDLKNSTLARKLFDLGRVLLGHKVFPEECEEKEIGSKIEVTLHRCPVSENWFVDIHGQASEMSKVLPHSNWFNYFFSVADNDAEYYPSHFFTDGASDKCVVGSDLVRTFDGFVFHYKATQCWTVVAQSCSTKSEKLLVRSPEATVLEAKYIDEAKGLVIEYLNKTLTVNGKVVDANNGTETIKNDAGKSLLVIQRKNDYYTVKLSKNSYINFKDRIEVRADAATWDDICGLCGNNDGEPDGDLVGPQGCLYDDPASFAVSWAEESDLCDKNTLSEAKESEKIEHHVHCQMDDHASKTDILCMAHDWNVTYNERDFCISSWPIPYCEDACDFTDYSDVSVNYYCWPQGFVPDKLKDSPELTEDDYNGILSYEHHWEEERRLSLPRSCKKFATIND